MLAVLTIFLLANLWLRRDLCLNFVYSNGLFLFVSAIVGGAAPFSGRCLRYCHGTTYVK